MTTRDGLKASSVQPKINSILNNAEMVGNDLILYKKGGGRLNAGRVRGIDGVSGPTPTLYSTKSVATTTLPSGTVMAVPSWTFVEGDSSFVTYDGTTNFTLTESGLYFIIAAITYPSNPTGRRIVFVYSDTNDLKRIDSKSGGTACTPQVEHFQYLTAGSVLTVRGYQNSGVSLNLGSNPGHTLQILRIA